MIKNPFKVAKARILRNLETFRRMIMMGPVGQEIRRREELNNVETASYVDTRTIYDDLQETDEDVVVEFDYVIEDDNQIVIDDGSEDDDQIVLE